MTIKPLHIIYPLVMVAVIISLDLLFFRQRFHFWERLMANVGIVLVFTAFYLRFLKG
ncbi:MAG: hypothetical protein ACK2TT_07845 [Anaerolineales bacterium]|jgi:hypothetical protein